MGSIESLPDGNYIYGDESKREYLSFRKIGYILVGMKSVSNTDNVSCFIGNIDGGNILADVKAGGYEPMGRVNGKFISKYITNNNPIDFGQYTRQNSYRFGSGYDNNPTARRDADIQSCTDEIAREFGIVLPTSQGSKSPSPSNTIAPIKPNAPVSKNPTQQDLITLVQGSWRQQVISLTDAQKRDRQRLLDKASPFQKPFTGGWSTADGQRYFVYPSTRSDKKRQSCIIIEKNGSQSLQIGVAVGGNAGTDMNVGSERMFKTDRNDVLALRTIESDRLISLHPIAGEASLTNGNLEEMQQNGCMTALTEIVRTVVTEYIDPTDNNTWLVSQDNKPKFGNYWSPEDIGLVFNSGASVSDEIKNAALLTRSFWWDYFKEEEYPNARKHLHHFLSQRENPQPIPDIPVDKILTKVDYLRVRYEDRIQHVSNLVKKMISNNNKIKRGNYYINFTDAALKTRLETDGWIYEKDGQLRSQGVDIEMGTGDFYFAIGKADFNTEMILRVDYNSHGDIEVSLDSRILLHDYFNFDLFNEK